MYTARDIIKRGRLSALTPIILILLWKKGIKSVHSFSSFHSDGNTLLSHNRKRSLVAHIHQKEPQQCLSFLITSTTVLKSNKVDNDSFIEDESRLMGTGIVEDKSMTNNISARALKIKRMGNEQIDKLIYKSNVNNIEAEAIGKNDSFQNTTSVVISVLLLNLVTIIWGTQHSIIKLVLDDESILPSCFSFMRFFIAALVAAPFTPGISGSKSENEGNNDVVWRWGIEMGCWMLLGYAFQAIGLQYTTAQRSGFLLYLNVKFVPIFARVILGRSISVVTWTSAATALIGTGLLSYDGSPPNIGDLWSIGAAAVSAMFILRLEAANEAVGPDQSSGLNAACLWVVTGGCFLWSTAAEVFTSTEKHITLFQSLSHIFSDSLQVFLDHPWEMSYLGIVTTAFANYIQTKGQRGVSAERASIIYAMDPVYGAGFANLILGEALGTNGIIGASMITLAAITTAVIDSIKPPTNNSEKLS